MRYTLFLILSYLLLSSPSFAGNYELSDAIQLPRTGWDKVLQTSNGNTMLFHFEPRKAVIVKVFDKQRKEIASEKYLGKLIDNSALERSEVHGIYEINGEAVIFISQSILNIETLVRVCFNTETGKLIVEKPVVSSSSFKKRLSFSVVRNTIHGGYAVFCMKDLVSNFEDHPFLEIFDEKHNSIRKVAYKTNREDFDYTHHVNTCIGDDGTIVIVFDCCKIINYPKEEEHSIVTCYLPQGDTFFSISITKLPRYVSTHYGLYSYNDFGKRRNVFALGSTTIVYKNGLQTLAKPRYSLFMLRYLQNNLANMNYTQLDYALAREKMEGKVDSNNPFMPLPLKLHTNKFGLNTLISEDIKQNLILEGVPTSYTYLGDIVITQINDEGKEVWSINLPKRQFLKNSVSGNNIRNRGCHKYLFRHDDPTTDWYDQFVSFNSIVTEKGDCYIIHNDLKDNFNDTIANQLTPVSNYTNRGYEQTDAIVYKITKRRDVTKEYLLDNSLPANYAVMTEGADYNKDFQTYAGLFLYNDGKSERLKLGWRKLD